MITFALYNLKGGVGKTTTAVNLAALSAQEGYRTLLWDVDPQAASSYFFQTEGGMNGHTRDVLVDGQAVDGYIRPTSQPHLDIIPGDLGTRRLDALLAEAKGKRSRFKQLLRDVEQRYDYVFLDCPPTLNLVAENVFKSANFVLLPIIPSALTERTFAQVQAFFDEHDYDARKLVPFFNLVDKRRRVHQDTLLSFRAAHDKCLRTAIPATALIERMGTQRAPVVRFGANSPLMTAYRSLWMELKQMRKLKSRKVLGLHLSPGLRKDK